MACRKRSEMHRSHPSHRAWTVLALGVAAAPGVCAQSANCEAFKARVAASIEAKGISGYVLEFVPGRTAAPQGSRSVGTCDGGAYTLMYRRWAGAPPPAAASAADVQPAAQPAVGAEPKAEAKTSSRVSAKSKAERSPKPTAEPTRETVAAPTPASAPAPSPPASAAPIAAVLPTPMASAPGVPSPGTAVAAAAMPTAAPASGSSFDDVARRVAWVAAGVLVAFAALRGWRRWRYRRYYDEAGLPRGPRLTL